MKRSILDTDQKALEINLDESIYGSFAEIGAGQEVARIFFKVGAAAGTVAKSMSAYDKIFSDRIYGEEMTGRYVCLSRLEKMLKHEYNLMIERLRESRENTRFFVFADTIAAINYSRTVNGHGWLGLRFQLDPDTPPNDIILHVRMLDRDNMLQQSSLGVLGVNMLYACFYYHHEPEEMIRSLMDNLWGRIQIDLIRMNGPDFAHLDNRLLSFYLLKNNMTNICMFDKNGMPLHPSEFMYKKSLMVVRGHYRPPTVVSKDVFKSGLSLFKKEFDLGTDEALIMAELTLDNLREGDKLDEQDFLARTELIMALGVTTILTNYPSHQGMINYLSDYKIRKLGLIIGARQLLELIQNRYYEHSEGSLLMAFGELFSTNIRVYVYPVLDTETGEILTSQNLPVPRQIELLYKYLVESNHIVDIEDYEKDKLKILPSDVLAMIQNGEEGWEQYVPPELVKVVKDKGLFGFTNQLIA